MRKLSESIWSDIQDRSSGKVIRKEDDVNHMNFDTFADYIKDNYSEKGDWFSVVESDNERSKHIEIDIISGIDLSFNVVDGEIYNILIHNNVNKYIDVPGLKKIFNVNILGSSTFSVVEKDWTKSNNTFVKLIEFFLKKKTNESIWSDIQDRSAGETIRKEDDINHLNRNEMYSYFYDTYPNYKDSKGNKVYMSCTSSAPNLKDLYINIAIRPPGVAPKDEFYHTILHIIWDRTEKNIVKLETSARMFTNDWKADWDTKIKELKNVFKGYTIKNDSLYDFTITPRKGMPPFTNRLIINFINGILKLTDEQYFQ